MQAAVKDLPVLWSARIAGSRNRPAKDSILSVAKTIDQAHESVWKPVGRAIGNLYFVVQLLDRGVDMRLRKEDDPRS